jgi:hypothetical protein
MYFKKPRPLKTSNIMMKKRRTKRRMRRWQRVRIT